MFSTLDLEAAIERLAEAGIAYGRLNDMAGLASHPQLRRVMVETPSGNAEVVAEAAMRSGKDRVLPRVPSLGEHSQSLREEFS